MQEEDLLNLDVRLLDPMFGAKDRDDVNPERVDLGIFYLDGSELRIVKIQGGWQILKGIKHKYSPYVLLSFPTINRHNTEIVQDILTTRQPTETKFSKAKFRVMGETFLEEYVLGRLESELKSAEEYIAAKQGMPLKQEEGGIRITYADKRHDRYLNQLKEYILEAPALLNLPPNPKKTYCDVRLDNKLARCITNAKNYEKFRNGDHSTNSNFTICDLIIQYSSKEYYIIELKTIYTTDINEKPDPIYYLESKGQLAKMAMFFQKNFQVYPTLVRVLLNVNETGEKLRSCSYKYFDGGLSRVKPE